MQLQQSIVYGASLGSLNCKFQYWCRVTFHGEEPNQQTRNVRAGLARCFTPPQLTLRGREKSIATIAEGKPEDDLLYTPLRETDGGSSAARPGEAQIGSCKGDS